MNEQEHQPLTKIARLNREVIVTEKIDGTNAQIVITDDGLIYAGSRNRWITPEKDNFGFAKWVAENTDELLKLGPGRHYGEWWGLGIQRGYGLAEKRFSLFNVHKWSDDAARPACCSVVPVLGAGNLLDFDFRECAETLRKVGSVAAPGFMNPEGIVVFHTASSTLYKYTLDANDEHKGAGQ